MSVTGQIDYEAVFDALHTPNLLMTPDLVIRAVNSAFLTATRRRRDDLVGRPFFEVFPPSPDGGEEGAANLRASLRRVLDTGNADVLAMQRYDIPVDDGAGGVRFERRYWTQINTPIYDRDGRIALILHRAEDVTAFASGSGPDLPRERSGSDPGWIRILQADLFARARDLQSVNASLREAYEREHETALTLQRAMLPTVSGEAAERTATRYRPATSTLNVCGDWYDVTALGPGRLAVAVGDVVGRGLGAAAVMGQLRAALVSATGATGRPDRALEILDNYARTVDGALGSTAVKVVVDFDVRRLEYSLAGHPPPLLLHADGRVELLADAVGPPLGATLDPVERQLADAEFEPGALLVLYTDGLVERRGEPVTKGIERLAAAVRRHAGPDVERTADAVLAELAPADGSADDVAVVIVKL
jgi:hypothetical protein